MIFKNDLILNDKTHLKNAISKRYKLFNEKNYSKWVEDNYRKISDTLSCEEKTVLAEYCKQDTPLVNQILRGKKATNSKINRKIKVLKNILTKKKLDKNILVYRVSNKYMFEEGDTYIEKGFMSTSLIDGDINTIHQPWEYKYIILVRKKYFGFYVDFISCRYGEFEFLLSNNLKLKMIKEYKDSNGKKIVLCKVAGVGK